MSEQPDAQASPLKRRDPTEPLSPAHKALIAMLAEIAVTDYLAEENAKMIADTYARKSTEQTGVNKKEE